MQNLVKNILNCSSSPENWDTTLDCFNKEFEITSSCMFSLHELHHPNMNFSWSDFLRNNLTTDMRKLMESGGDVGDIPAYDHLYNNPAQVLYEELEIFGVEHRADLPPSNVREITEHLGFYTRCGASLNRTGPWIDGFFCQHRSAAEADRFLRDTRSRIILPIMANSVSLGRTLQALSMRFRKSLSMLDSLGIGVFLIDSTGSTIVHNKEGQRIIDSNDGFTINRHKRIKLNNTDKTKELESLIDNANSLFEGNFITSGSMLSSERPSGAYDYLISVWPLSDHLGELEPGLECAFVTIIDPERENSISAEGIAKLGGLSGAESKIVGLLIQGLRPVEIAEHRNVSPNTIKTQLKQISQKLRCSTQSDIIRIAAATNLPIEADVYPSNG